MSAFDPKRTSHELKSTSVENRVRCTENQGFRHTLTGVRPNPYSPWQTSKATGHLFLLFFFLFSFFLLIKLGLFLLFPLALVFFSLITHICFSLFESGFPKWLPPVTHDASTKGRSTTIPAQILEVCLWL